MPLLSPYTLFLPVAIFVLMGWGGCRVNENSPPHKQAVDSLEAKIDLMRTVSPDLAVKLAHQGLESAKGKKLPHYQIRFMGIIGKLFSNEGRPREAVLYFDQAIDLAIAIKDTLSQAKILSNRGYAHLLDMKQDQAMQDITNSILLLNKLKNADPEQKNSSLFNAYLDLMSLYAGRLEYDKAFSFADSCRNRLDQYKNSTDEARFYYELAWLQLNKGNDHSEIPSLQSSIQHYRKGAALFRDIDNKRMAQSSNLFISDAFEIWKEVVLAENGNQESKQSRQLLDSSNLYLEKHINNLRATNSLENLASALQTLGQKSLELQKFELAKSHTMNSLRVAGQLESRRDSALGYWLMAEIYEAIGKLDSAIWYLQQYDLINYNERRIASEEALKFAEAGFQTEKKELENQKIRIEARQRLQGTISIALVVGLLLISIAFYYYISNINKQKLMAQQRKINQQLVIDLMKEQTIESLNSRLQGQEKERKRIAKELHDTLGGTLAALKLSMDGLKRNLDEDTKDKFKHPQQLLNIAYQETRLLSHEMMALPLKHLGLEASLKALCETINRSGKIKVEYQAKFPKPLNFSNEEGTHIYRIIQELLQNVIKHARADRVWVQLQNDEIGFSLSVKDNGRGFPKTINKSTQGMGLSNIEDRVKGLRGELNIESEPGKGSKATIFLPKESLKNSKKEA